MDSSSSSWMLASAALRLRPLLALAEVGGLGLVVLVALVGVFLGVVSALVGLRLRLMPWNFWLGGGLVDGGG